MEKDDLLYKNFTSEKKIKIKENTPHFVRNVEIINGSYVIGEERQNTALVIKPKTYDARINKDWNILAAFGKQSIFLLYESGTEGGAKPPVGVVAIEMLLNLEGTFWKFD